MSSSVAVPLEAAAAARRGRPARPGLLLVAVLLGVAPFVLTALDVVLRSRGVALGGDQAVLELAVREAADGERSVGAYSRYAWSHPGPLWFYALAPVYLLLGSGPVGLHLAVLAVHAAVAAALVVVAGRAWGPSRALAAAAAVVVAWAVLGVEVFRSVWNPYALLLPTVLLLLLAALAAAGRRPGTALAAAALVGTFLVQTHVGTAVLVAAVGALAALGALVHLLRRRPTGLSRAALALWGVTVLAWVPPLLQELRPGTGNLSLLLGFQQSPHEGQTWTEAAAALGAQLLVLPTAGRAQELPEAAAALGTAEAVALLLAGLVPVVLGLLALAARRPVTAALALASLVATLAALYSVTQVEGVPYGYLVVWTAVLPLAPALCAADLALAALQRRRPAAALASRPGPVAVAAAGVLALAALVALPSAPPLSAESRYGTAAFPAEVAGALGPPAAGPVRLRIASSDAWPVAAGLLLALERAGYDARVTEDWTFMFGPERASTGREPREVVLVAPPQRALTDPLPDVRELSAVTSSVGTTYVLLRDPPGDAPVPVLPGPVTGK